MQRRYLFVFLIPLTLMALFVACGGDDDDVEPAEEPTTAAETATETEAETATEEETETTAETEEATGEEPRAATEEGTETTGGEVALTIVGKDISFLTTEFEAPPSTDIALTFDNQDSGVPHNFELFQSEEPGEGDFLMSCVEGCQTPGGGPTSEQVTTAIAQGPEEQTFIFTTPGEEGEYGYWCAVHPTQMTGTMTIREGAAVPSGGS